MQPKSKLVETQQALAEAVRLGHAAPLHGYAPNRLAVYARLVRNNTFGFIDRCYVEAPAHINAKLWVNSKETFVKEGKAHSPYFQDIAGEFLHFCQTRHLFPSPVLDLMDFEHTQLLAEVSMAKVPEQFEWDKETVMQLSPTAYLKHYDIDFFSSNFRQFEQHPSQLVIWRDSDFYVNQQSLAELDFWLLRYLQEQPSAFTDVLSALNTVVEDSKPLIPLLEKTWLKWINAEVIYPLQA